MHLGHVCSEYLPTLREPHHRGDSPDGSGGLSRGASLRRSWCAAPRRRSAARLSSARAPTLRSRSSGASGSLHPGGCTSLQWDPTFLTPRRALARRRHVTAAVFSAAGSTRAGCFNIAKRAPLTGENMPQPGLSVHCAAQEVDGKVIELAARPGGALCMDSEEALQCGDIEARPRDRQRPMPLLATTRASESRRRAERPRRRPCARCHLAPASVHDSQVPVRGGAVDAAAFALARDVLGPAGGAALFRRHPRGPVAADAVTFYKSVGTAVQARPPRGFSRGRRPATAPGPSAPRHVCRRDEALDARVQLREMHAPAAAAPHALGAGRCDGAVRSGGGGEAGDWHGGDDVTPAVVVPSGGGADANLPNSVLARFAASAADLSTSPERL